ncbi:MAG TPA: TIGR03118 family protein [Chthoniobacterales bacterium]|jgi:uncharacterized protein (TIGR03118 family)|nr:TIGR03118 family protein [Chthoniobacterales bacterium]
MRTVHVRTALFTAAALFVSTTFALANSFDWENLQSDIAGVAEQVDPNVVNPWGMALAPSGNIWVADNHTGVSTVYKQDGTPAPNAANPLVVTIPPSATNPPNTPGSPTGIVFNGTSFFKVTKGTSSQPAKFIFVSEDGMISGWNPTLDSTNALPAKDNGASGAVYKGATLGVANGHNFLYVANFHAGTVETYNESFQLQSAASFPFFDPTLPTGYAPFGIRNLKGKIYVTYAKQKPPDNHDDQSGPGNGYVSVFNTSGGFIKRLISQGNLNSPWGLEIVNGALWVGNFGDGRINVYNLNNGNFVGTPRDVFGNPLDFNGLWGLLLADGGLYFSAGIADEAHGLWGVIFSAD